MTRLSMIEGDGVNGDGASCQRKVIMGSSALSVQIRQAKMIQNNSSLYCFKLNLQWQLPRAIRKQSCQVRL